MYFSEFNILKFLNNLVNLENEKYLQSISEVSLDYTNEKSLIKSLKKTFQIKYPLQRLTDYTIILIKKIASKN